MAILKVTILCNFLGSPSAGFAESWTQEKSIGDFETAATALAQFRRGTLSKDWYIAGVRAGHMKVAQRVSPGTGLYVGETLVQLPCAAFGPAAVGQLGRADTPWTSVFIKMPTTGVGSRVFRPRLYQMRGVPDSLWTDAAFSKSVAGVQLGPWLNAVTSNGGTFSCGTAFVPAGAVAGDTPGFGRYYSYCIERASSRRIGRPFGLLRGRQSSATVTA